jgi:TIR domain-containing protein/pentapeptide repeat protein
MANQEHLDILNQGVNVWNRWRKKYPNIQPDLCRANLHEYELSGVNFNQTYLYGVNLFRAILNKACLVGVHLHDADLSAISLIDANLSSAYFSRTNLGGARLRRADFSKASLREVNFVGSDLDGADLTQAYLDQSIFGGVDLRQVKGLDTVRHVRPSSISLDTLILSHGSIPEVFLRGAGVQEPIIEQIPALIGSLKPIDYYTCFISYSSMDEDFAERLYADLQSNGVRCWFAPHDLRTGQRIRHGIDEAIRQHEKLLLILSEHSVTSTWVEFEVEAALDKEKNGSEVLFPIRLDPTVLNSNVVWASHLKRTRNIGDFTRWKNHDDYQKAFTRLLRDLKAEAQKMESRDTTT